MSTLESGDSPTSSPASIKDNSLFVLDRAEIRFSGRPSVFDAKAEVETYSYYYKEGATTEVATISNANTSLPSVDDQYAYLESAREGFENSTKLSTQTKKRRLVAGLPALDATYEAHDPQGGGMPMYTTWLLIDSFVVNLLLICPETAYDKHRVFLEDIRQPS